MKTRTPKMKKAGKPLAKNPFEDASVLAEPNFSDFCENTISPVLSEFLARLHIAISAALAENTRPLFCYRAGLRIYYLYQQWLTARGEKISPEIGVIKTSRLAALKAGYAGARAVALTGIGMQLPGLDTQAVVALLLDKKINTADKARIEGIPLHEFIETDHPLAKALCSHFQEQSDLMAAYLKKLSNGRKKIMLIDSGWAGTTQLIFEQAFPQYTFEGCYFGTMGKAVVLDQTPGKMRGLIFEQDNGKFDSRRPETIFTVHRHLIESILEPDIASVRSIDKTDIAKFDIAALRQSIIKPSCDWDHIFGAVTKSIAANAKQGPATRLAAYNLALQRLQDVLLFPDLAAANLAQGKFRSSDMGRDCGLFPLSPAKDRSEYDSTERRIEDSLWHAGQAAIEHPQPAARLAEQQRLAKETIVSQANSHFVASTDVAAPEADIDTSVAIITRTKDRPLLLKRAAASVAAQTYTNFEWVIVNDGGDLASVLATVDASLADPSKITICHNPRSLGMEAASNKGIRSSNSKWLVIHDDDDSWHPDFLATGTQFLEKNRNIYKGVISGTVYVEEEIIGETVIERYRTGYQQWVKSVQLSEMATGNFFAPIAFLYDRSIFNAVGGYDPKLPVLGDWDFNLRFLLEADIGVVETNLAYYHHRIATKTGAYSNSVVGGIDKHIAYNAIVRNKYVRQSASDPRMATLANLTSLGYLHVDTRSRFDRMQNEISGMMVEDKNTKEKAKSLDYQLMDERWIMVCALAERMVNISNGTLSVKQIVELPPTEILKLIDVTTLLVPPDFDEDLYLKKYPDVASGIKSGAFGNGYVHYVMFGRAEGRQRPESERSLN